jgi:hypothetical protein
VDTAVEKLGITDPDLGMAGGQPDGATDGQPTVHILWITVVHKSTGV